MRIPESSICLLVVVAMAPGCSQTNWVRPGAGSNMRTVASVGDKPLPSVSGEPGSSLAQSTMVPVPHPPARESRDMSMTRMDNRYPRPRFDWLSVARQVARSTSPRPIRPVVLLFAGCADKPYTVIAEYQGEDGLMTGRVEVEAPAHQCQHQPSASRFRVQPRIGRPFARLIRESAGLPSPAA